MHEYAQEMEQSITNYRDVLANVPMTGRAIEESFNPRQQAKSDNKGVHLAVAEHMDEIICQSIEAEEHPDYIKNKNRNKERDTNIINDNALMHRFYGAITVEDKTYRVMTLMREDKQDTIGNGVHAYDVTKVELLNDETPSSSSGGHGIDANTTSVAVAKLLQDVEKSTIKAKKS